MSLTFQLRIYQKKINKIIENFFVEKEKEFSHLPEIQKIILDLKNFVLRGGKRLRGFLTLIGYEFFGGKENMDILKFSASVELLHSALLAHDDIIDKDILRRGLPTLHKKYSSYAGVIFGNQIALQAANLLFSFGSGLALQTNFSPSKKIKALKYLREKLFKTALGEILDVHFSGRTDLKEKDILKIHTLKTANYTIEAPFFCGAILAGKNPKEIKKFGNWTIKLGQIFQTKDDLLGMFRSQKIIGKPVGADLKEGKMTLVFKKAKEILPFSWQKKLFRAFGRENIKQKQIEQIKKILYHFKIEKEVEKETEKIKEEIKKEILKLPFSFYKKKILLALADFVVEREK